MLTVGSLCSGIGGLELGIERALGARTVWHAELDRHASTVLAHHWPDVINHGDLTATDWAAVEAPDVVCAGFPCQPVSQAGRRRGVNDERWLWDDLATALGRMDPRPRLCLFENVPGLLSANDGAAVARVVHGLAALGYVGRYGLLRSSDVGAPHRRERVFIAAALADAYDQRPAVRLGRSGPVASTGHRRSSAAHTQDHRLAGTRPARGRGTGPADRGHVAADAHGERLPGRPEHHRQPAAPAEGHHQLDELDADGRVRWGTYAGAVARWERLHGPAPAPRDNRGRLNPALPEWMLGYPPGWVTDLPIPRTAQLRVLGNSVQPQVAEAAARLLLAPLLDVDARGAA